MLIVQLLPAGAMRVLGVQMSSLTDRHEQLDAVIGSVPSQIGDGAQGDADDAACVRMIEQWLLKRLGLTRVGPGPVSVTFSLNGKQTKIAVAPRGDRIALTNERQQVSNWSLRSITDQPSHVQRSRCQIASRHRRSPIDAATSR